MTSARVVILSLLGTTALLGGSACAGGKPTAAEIVAHNVEARGGAAAWRKVDTMIWVGHIEDPRSRTNHLPFVLEMKRPDKSRFEIRADNQMSVRMFDGKEGWTIRTVPNGRPSMRPYSAAEVEYAKEVQVIDGQLIDYQTKGNDVSLEGEDQVEGHKAYRLRVLQPSGIAHHVWIDAKTYLELRSDREAHTTLGASDTVYVYYRHYDTIKGLRIPLVVESGSAKAGSKARNRLVIDRVVLNPQLPDKVFTRPGPRQQNHHPDGRHSVAALTTDVVSGRPLPGRRDGGGE